MAALIAAITVGAILYRIPRGGPSRPWWVARRLSFVSYLNEEIWAVGLAGATALALGSWWPLTGALVLWAGERVGYMHLVTTWRVDVWRLNLRGLLLLNPIMGFIYEFWRERDVPVYQPLLDGWTAYAELTCGAVTAAVFVGLWWAIL